ncbi:GMC family oxidoreductase [Pseudonocardia sp. CA-142604]|uniref:GMC family oxidoreductase n=1 Tax=Pseudonocardia sp. CA-142604 TaxID=3240024 RepID=UPI003D923F0D
MGGGSAGCVIAARLSEDENVRVLLLEAGGPGLDRAAVPHEWLSLLSSSMDWGTGTVELAATGAPMPWPRGRGLGGSSAINGMVFTRGHPSSYDAWVENGAKGWGFLDLLPYAMGIENTTGRAPGLRGRGGPLTVAPANEPHPVTVALLDGAVERGLPRVRDVSAGVTEGVGLADLNIVDGARQSAADAYLAPALHRTNLDVVTGATARRLTVERGRCTGVEYTIGNEVLRAACSEEVVLTAGVVGSPQLLLLSGIGPGAHLREAGIAVTLDLQGVGSNLHDHPISTVVHSAPRPMPPGRYNHAEAIGLVRSSSAADVPDLQLLFTVIPHHAPVLVGPENGYSIGFSAMLPHSRGTVRLNCAVPTGVPLVDPAYLTDERDMDVMIAGLEIAREIGRAPALDPWRGEEVLPDPSVRDERGMRSFLRTNLLTYFHGVGTCRIGIDDGAVVAPDLRVHGIVGLRVADASVMPSIVSANTNATVYAIAERAADLLSGRGPAGVPDGLGRSGLPDADDRSTR